MHAQQVEQHERWNTLISYYSGDKRKFETSKTDLRIIRKIH